MKPYKGYLIDTYAEIVQTPSGFGMHIPGPKMQVWRVRIIESATGRIEILPEGTSTQQAERYIDQITDPTGKVKEREYIAEVIRSTKNMIAMEEAQIDLSKKSLVSLNTELERLRAEYKAAGGEDGQE